MQTSKHRIALRKKHEWTEADIEETVTYTLCKKAAMSSA